MSEFYQSNETRDEKSRKRGMIAHAMGLAVYAKSSSSSNTP